MTFVDYCFEGLIPFYACLLVTARLQLSTVALASKIMLNTVYATTAHSGWSIPGFPDPGDHWLHHTKVTYIVNNHATLHATQQSRNLAKQLYNATLQHNLATQQSRNLATLQRNNHAILQHNNHAILQHNNHATLQRNNNATLQRNNCP
jgi:hypothetical protein